MNLDLETMFKIFMIFEIFQIGVMGWTIIRGQKKQTELMESIINNPDYAATVGTNMALGLMHRIATNEADAKKFFGFVQVCGAQAFNGIRGVVAQTGEEDLKGLPANWKKFYKGIKAFMNLKQQYTAAQSGEEALEVADKVISKDWGVG